MAYIGNTVENQGFTPAIDYFNGNGVTVTFTLSRPIASVAQVIVAVDNVIQNPSSAFGVVGNSITFTSAPLSGTNNIWVEYTSLITTYQGISQDPTVIGDIRATGGYLAEGDFGNSFVDGNLIDYVTGRGRFTVGELDDITFYHGGTGARSPMMDLYYAGGAKIYGTTALTLPSGTTGERPGTPVNGMIRYNSTTGFSEVYQNGAWSNFGSPISPNAVNYLVIAGGGGGGSCAAGGGAGGYRCSVPGEFSGGGASAESSFVPTAGSTYTVTVGAGGAGGAPAADNSGVVGSNSVFATITSVGGGAGAALSSTASSSGGCGGGQGNGSGPGTGTAGQGYAGGASNAGPANYPGGGGGGAGSAGTASNNSTVAGDGGSGVTSSITGSAVARAGGGGGSCLGGGTGGSATAGGGIGRANQDIVGVSGTANTGGGGGAGSSTGFGGGTRSGGGAGGSGLVVISYSNTFKLATATGTVTQTTSGGNYIFTFTGSGTIVF